MKHVIRSVMLPKLPQIAVVRLNPDQTGTDIAWFYKLSDAREYIAWKEKAKPTPRRGVEA